MKLISCYIENFGLIHASSFNFSKGLNCCLSENGTGKTTLTAFIEAMLYGIGDTRRQTLDENPRKKYLPWQGGKFGGSLTLEIGKKRYTVERSFGARPADDTFRLIDADSGRVSEDYGEDIGERIFGIDRDGFLRTAFLSERNLRGKNENKSISAKLSDLVGVDGDVGEFDEALKLLEERRKFYFKKGGAGEIANVKEKINEVERRIDTLSAIEKEIAEKEAGLKSLNAEGAKLRTEEEAIKAKLEGISKQRERTGHEERYATMLATVKMEKDRLAKVTEFFASGVPTKEEIDAARDAKSEAERLKKEALREQGNEEYVALDAYFKNGTSFAEIAEIERTAELAEQKEKEISAIDGGYDERSKEMRLLFPEEAPTPDEIREVKRRIKKSLLFGIPWAFGIILVVMGALLGGRYAMPMLIGGLALAIIPGLSLIFGKKRKYVLSFFHKYNVSKSFSDIEKRAKQYEELKLEREMARATLSDDYSALTLKICDFLGKFPVPDADSMLDAVRVIRYKYTQFYALGHASEREAGSKLEKLKRSDELSIKAREFLLRFPTVTDAPFTEIRDRLSDLIYLRASVSRLESECDDYAVKYGVTGKGSSVGREDEVTLKNHLAEINERSRATAARIALLDREINLARVEIDRKEEYEMQREELAELYQKHVESLDVIKKTSLYLTEACDNITSKYLGKTKKGFEEYSRLIAGSDGEYTLNTSFELSRTELGESHGIESYSRGIRDLYSLGLRLALIDALYENEAPFIVLDDPFIAFDDEKLERAKATLKSIARTKQILYFTCSKSRAIE